MPLSARETWAGRWRALPAAAWTRRRSASRDYDAAKAEALAKELGCLALPDNASAVREADYVLLAVKPQVMPAVLAGIRPVLEDSVEKGEKKVLVTIAAGPADCFLP